MINKEQLKEIMNDLADVCLKLDVNVSEEVMFQEACTYQRGMLVQENKQTNMNLMKSKPLWSSKIEDTPTDKQLQFMKKIGLKTEGLSRIQITKIINDFIDNQRTQ